MSTSKDVADMLTRHYLPESRPPAGWLAFEVTSPCGSRRADAMWAPMTSNSGGLVGHEIKVSRGDLLTELADPAKADPWLRYCERWWLTVSDPALVVGLDIPDAWGVMAPPSGRRTRSMTVIRPAPKLKPANTAPAYERLLRACFHRGDESRQDLARQLRMREAEVERLRREVSELRLGGGTRPSPVAARLARLVAEIEQVRRANREFGDLDMDLVRDAVLDASATRALAEEARAEIHRLLESVRHAANPLGRVAEELARLDAGEPRNGRKRGAA